MGAMGGAGVAGSALCSVQFVLRALETWSEALYSTFAVEWCAARGFVLESSGCGSGGISALRRQCW
jgi:hypothetical protein